MLQTFKINFQRHTLVRAAVLYCFRQRYCFKTDCFLSFSGLCYCQLFSFNGTYQYL
jgi:hypothetical protein